MVRIKWQKLLPVTHVLLLKALSLLKGNKVTVGNSIFIKDIEYIDIHYVYSFRAYCYLFCYPYQNGHQFTTPQKCVYNPRYDYKDTI